MLLANNSPVANGRLLEVDPQLVDTPASNREITLESVAPLLESLETHGQLIPGILAPDPNAPGRWICLEGNRRLLCCRVLGLPFKAIEHQGAMTEGQLAITRFQIDRHHKHMTDDEKADQFQLILAECESSSDAAQRAGISRGELSKIMSFEKTATPELVAAVKNRQICRSSARHIGRLPPLTQATVLADAIAKKWKRDRVEAEVKRNLPGKKGKERPLRLVWGSTTLIFNTRSLANVQESYQRLGAALKVLVKENRPLEDLSALLKDPST